MNRMLMLVSLFGSLVAQDTASCDPSGKCSAAFMTDHFCTACATPLGELIKQMNGDQMCTINQPLYNSPEKGWTKMTYSNYGLDFAVKTTTKSEQDNPPWSGVVAMEAFNGDCNADYSALSGDGTGSITSTQTSESGMLEITRTWELASASSSTLKVTVEFKNVRTDGRLYDIEAFYGTRDDWVGDTDGPTKTPAMVTSNGVDMDVSGGNAVVVKSGNEAVILYSPHPSARGLYAGCCSFANVMRLPDPSTWTGEDSSNDGSYAVYVNVGNLEMGQTTSADFFYGVGEPTAEALNAVATEAATGAIPQPEGTDAQIFDDPHVRTLSGNQFFLHGVGVFDYATIPGVIKTQVYMCPFAPCTKEMMDTGDCLTFINAVAIRMENVENVHHHTVVLRNSSLLVDNNSSMMEERKGDVNFTLGGMVITASGKGRATELPDRVDHDSLAACHQLPTAGQVVPKSAETQLAAKRSIGGVWQDCTRNEWTMTTPDMAIQIGVIGPFEDGYLKEAVGDRTFNLDVSGVKDMFALEGIINGDKNGLFVVDPGLNPEPNAESGTLVPWGPHGNVQEVTAANVKGADVLFPKEAIEKLDAMCGKQQAMRGMLVKEGKSATKEQKDGWKSFKSRPSQRK